MASPSSELIPGILKSFTDHMRDQWTAQAVDGRKYVRTRRMTDWMRARDSNEVNANGDLLRSSVYEAAHKSPSEFVPVEWKNILNDNCIITFGLLIDLGYGHLIHVFRQHSIHDYLLCKTGDIIKQSMLKGHFENPANLQSFVDDFESRRWEFSPVEFALDMDIDLEDRRRVLPFCHKERINHKGATAELYEVAVEEDFIQECLRDAIQGSRYTDRVFGFCYRFAFKSYSEGWQDIYNIEKNAFKGIGNEQDLVKCLGTVQCVEDPQTSYDDPNVGQQRSYNILLEYGEDDLNEYFYVHSPPTLSREIHDFWGNLFQIANALQRVHKLEKKTSNGNSIMFDGCHADVKPDNILLVQGNFKLADFGFARFVRRDKGSISPIGGTQTYGAPEFFQMAKRSANGDNASTVTSTIDTWSFACVISVAVTWVVLGFQGIEQFQTVRKAGIERIKSNPRTPTAHLLYDDTFHDGSEVLEDVMKWHEYLRKVMRKSDPISHRLLDLIEKDVLGPVPDRRLTSAEFYKELKNLLEETKGALDQQIPESIVKGIISFDRTAPSTMKEYQERLEASSLTQPEGGNSKHANKSARLASVVPVKVAHRQVLATRSQNSLGNGDPYRGNAPNCGPPADPTGTPPTPRLQEHNPKTSSPLKTSTITNVADTPIYKAHSLLLQNKKRRSLSFWSRPKEDPFLSNFIKGRDIKFIVDNGTSMKKHFENAKVTLQVLAEKVVASDEDGVDLVFTFGKFDRRNVKEPWREFDRAMSKAYEHIYTDPQEPLATDMAKTLGELFEEYEKKRTKQRTTLIILTDGIWEGSVRPNEVEEKIARFCKDSKRTNGFEDRPFTIQFVSFGGHATARLDALDDEMENKYEIPDVIDHEPWTGDPNKMILGSIVPKFDTTPTSSSANQQEMLIPQSQNSHK